ncbi:hypothetical protein PsorP6_008540 [Peronosclerospora sorghi]|uniref:Uncharacterized protein n=1 Tax=Peronosclerospora sorghi TaxID=230839 RepID=A0ACC0WA95_9STRA|nr:hypothetical protein PsorP6_008540 [Peronosclerospora sorghi]
MTQVDILDGLIVALDLLFRRTDKKKYVKKLIVITDASAKIADAGDLMAIVEMIKNMEVKFQVIGIDFEHTTIKLMEETEKIDVKEEPITASSTGTDRIKFFAEYLNRTFDKWSLRYAAAGNSERWPVEELRLHFGERVAFFLAFMLIYTKHLVPLTLACLVYYLAFRFMSSAPMWRQYMQGLALLDLSASWRLVVSRVLGPRNALARGKVAPGQVLIHCVRTER